MSAHARRGLLLFAHGARDPRWAMPFRDVAARIGARAPTVAVELAFLEFMAPDLLDAGRRLADTGCSRVDVVPLFLGSGGHVRKDLPALMQTLAGERPDVAWTMRPAIGEVDAVIEAMALAALASMEQSAP
ncbi:MAG: CbiX/SirB N-terminal domain-containing protein [Burkholderiaceae bacterium]